MITVRAKGGLGNQLFQYATGYSLAKRLGQRLSIDISFFPQDVYKRQDHSYRNQSLRSWPGDLPSGSSDEGWKEI